MYKIKHQKYIGKSRQEIIQELGNPFDYSNNHYPIHHDLWAFQIKKNWLGIKTILYIEFKNDIIVRTYTRKK